MKTKEEVKKHLCLYGYSDACVSKIMGFLIGVGIKKPDETLRYRVGNRTWQDFYDWWEKEEQELTDIEILEELLDDLRFDIEQHVAMCSENAEYYRKQYVVLKRLVEAMKKAENEK